LSISMELKAENPWRSIIWKSTAKQKSSCCYINSL